VEPLGRAYISDELSISQREEERNGLFAHGYSYQGVDMFATLSNPSCSKWSVAQFCVCCVEVLGLTVAGGEVGSRWLWRGGEPRLQQWVSYPSRQIEVLSYIAFRNNVLDFMYWRAINGTVDGIFLTYLM